MLNFKNNVLPSRRVVVLGLLLSLLVPPLLAGPVEEATAAFAAGDYAEAVRNYEAALTSNPPSAGLYENLATAQLKAGQRPEAALSLHRAILLNPQKMEARMALSDLERSLGVPHIAGGWRVRVAERAPLVALIVLGGAVFWLGAFLLLTPRPGKGRKFWRVVVVICCLLGGGALAAVGFLSDPRWMWRDAAVVQGEKGAQLLSAPADQSESVASLPGGATVRILRRSGDWTYARTPDGRTGWAPSSSLAAIVPAS